MTEYKYRNIGCTVSGVIIMKGFGEAQYALNQEAKNILEINKIDFFGSTDQCKYWLTVFKRDEEKAKNLLEASGILK